MSKSKVVHDLSPMLKIYEDGHVERLMGTGIVLPSLDDPEIPVRSKDVVFSPQANLYSRLYLPKSTPTNHKLPLLVYFHSGGFFVGTAFWPVFHNYLNKLVAEANVVAVSVDYRNAPEHPLPAAYDDSWTALKWVASHSNGGGPEEWLNLHADLDRVFLGGDSAGGNIAHNIGMRLGQEKLVGINLVGIVLTHPYFWGKEPIGDEAENLKLKSLIDSCWLVAYPTVGGLDDPVINPRYDSKLSKLGCRKVLVLVAEKDVLRNRGWDYYELLKNSGWEGCVEVMEAKEEDHTFHLLKPTCDSAVALIKKIAAFLNRE